MIKHLENKVKKLMEGCGGDCEKGGTCYHLSRDKQLIFNKDLTDSRLERVRMYCDSCKIEIFETKAQLRLLNEIVNKIDKSKAFSSHTKLKMLNKFFPGWLTLSPTSQKQGKSEK